MNQILLKDLIGSSNAITAINGEILQEKLREVLLKNESVTLDFERIDSSTTRFFNISIGELYSEFSEEQVDNQIMMVNVNKIIKQQIGVAKYAAKLYFSKK